MSFHHTRLQGMPTVMKRLTYCLFFLLFLSLLPQASAQSKKWAAGFRIGKSTGISAKFYANDSFSTEILLTHREKGLQVTGIAIFEEGEVPFLGIDPQIFWYYGIGGHAGYYRFTRNARDEAGNLVSQRRSRASVGVDGLIGAAWRPPNLPLDVSLDWKPYFDLFLPVSMSEGLFDIGVSVRYIF